jgi:hypothetical protein
MLPAHVKEPVLVAPGLDGLLAIELASRGYSVVAAEVPGVFQPFVKAETRDRGLDLVIQPGGSSWRWEQQLRGFGAVVSLWGPLGLGDYEDQTLLTAISKALIPNGRLLLDNQVMESLVPNFEERLWEEAGADIALFRRRYLPRYSSLHLDEALVPSTVDPKTEWFSDGSDTCALLRVYTVKEIAEMVERSGLMLLALFDAWGRHPFGLGAERLCLLAEKR